MYVCYKNSFHEMCSKRERMQSSGHGHKFEIIMAPDKINISQHENDKQCKSASKVSS